MTSSVGREVPCITCYYFDSELCATSEASPCLSIGALSTIIA